MQYKEKMIPLEQKTWSEFSISQLFNVYTGRDIIISKLEKGIYPVVSHTIENNGINFFTKNLENRRLFKHDNTISLADRGNFHSFVQPHNFYIGTRVKALEYTADNLNKDVLMFISQMINKQKVRFSYGFNATDKVENLKIMLPVTIEGKPDYDYMKKYILIQEIKEIYKALQYLHTSY
ncbi:restriction endonuclease subunit S [Treponema phagedenis]|uniref:restriction endonuclease subunit S n=1 Tax=Treponema phagedenis TaxID=162 RepID=UPI00046751CE|nr:restriction endonuclease subunit S [Treponema phagedenis]QKS91987.1 restriction endonuclease subunit S [Treponema phagedenis]QKS92463.1 restriction endonuclease subunit S [Treponema phagedenis]QLC57580.1 restriction endonuclease subunit S [Treponema phagedenis]